MMPQPQIQQGQPIDRTPVFKAAVAKYGPSMGLTMPEAQTMYQEMVANGAKKGQNLNAVPNGQLWAMIQHIADHPQMQKIHKQAVAAPQPQGQVGPKPVTGSMLHLASGGQIPPGQSAVVGDAPQDQEDGSGDNSEVVQNPAGNAPVTVNPSATNANPQQAATVVANVLGISPAAVLKAYSPEQIQQAYNNFDAKMKATAGRNSLSSLGAAMASYSDPNAMKNDADKLQQQRTNIGQDTIGRTLQGQKSLGEGITAASAVQSANEKATSADLGNQAKVIENRNSQLGSDLLKEKSDPTSNVSVGTRAALGKIGVTLPDSYSAAQAELITAGNAQAQKVINDVNDTWAKVQTAKTAEDKQKFNEDLVKGNPGQYVLSGGEPTLAPGQSSSQTQFADRKAKAEANVPVLDQTVSLFGDAIKMGMDPSVAFGKYSPTQLASLGTKAGNTYAAEQMFNQLKTQNLASMVSTVGGAGELRLAGVDASAMSQAPTVTESKKAAMNKMFLKMDQAIKLQDVSHQLHQYGGPLDGSKFSVDNTGKIAVWNPNTNATSMVPRTQLAEAEKEGKYNVSDGYNGFLLSASRGGQ